MNPTYNYIVGEGADLYIFFFNCKIAPYHLIPHLGGYIFANFQYYKLILTIKACLWLVVILMFNKCMCLLYLKIKHIDTLRTKEKEKKKERNPLPSRY